MEFEKKLKRLEDIVTQMEEGKLSLEEHMKIFKEGVQISKQCQKQLTEAEQKVKQLVDIDENSQAITQDFDKNHHSNHSN